MGALPEPEPGTRIGGREVVRLLGKGGMAAVYEVRDLNTGHASALKLMSTAAGPTDEVERRFRREFRALAKLQHPNIARVEDWGWWGERPYFVMELLFGRDLRAEVETWATIPFAERWEKARSVLIQTARALEYVHLRGLVHRDVTPSNIMVLPDGSVRLMDFGVVKEHDQHDMTSHGEVLGTVAYVAPEQISGESIDARTDLYSLGAVLYLMVTGKRPFNARTLAGYLDKHLHQPPRPPHELVPAVPRALEEISLRLLQKDPADRFASATHLLHVLEGADAQPLSLDARAWPPRLAGRTEAIATLTDAVNALRDGQGGVIFLSGAQGMGKTRLLRLALELARRNGLLANTLRGIPDSAPTGVFRVVVEALQAEGRPVPRVLAQLYHLDAGDSAVIERYTVFAAFRDILLGTPPRVIAVDDLQWADPGSLDLLEYLIRNTRSLASEKILWILARTDGVQDGRLDGLIDGSRTGVAAHALELDALDPAGVEELVLALVSDDEASRALARRLHKETDGNPALIGEMIRGLADDGILDPTSHRLTLDAPALARLALPIPRSVRERILDRLGHLSREARAVAEVLAVGRHELTVPTLAEAAELGEMTLLTALDALVDAGIVRERRGDAEEHYEIAQTQARDLLYAEIPVARRTDLHRRMGVVLEKGARRRVHLVVEELAWHFEQGDVPGKAFPYLVRAGQRLLQRSFAAEALGAFDRALAIEPEAREHVTLEDADRALAELLLLRADANEHLGGWAAVEPDLSRAALIAGELGDDRIASRAHAALGTRLRRRDDLDAAESHHAEALRLAESAGDTALKVMPLQGLGAVRWGKGDLEGARRYWQEALSVGEQSRDERSLGYGYNGLGLIALCRGQAAEARRHFEQSATIFEKLGALAPLAMARVNLVEIHHLTGNLRRGLELADKTCASARETNHPLALARGLCYRALLLVDLGRAGEALAGSLEAASLAGGLGNPEEELAALVSAIRAAWTLRELDTIRDLLARVDGLGIRFDAEGFQPLLLAWRARLAALDGDADGARALLARAEEPGGNHWAYQECRIALSVARAWAELGDTAAATRHAETALRKADAAGFRFYSLKAHALAAAHGTDDASVARHRRIADALARSLAANLPREDADRFLQVNWGTLAPAAGS